MGSGGAIPATLNFELLRRTAVFCSVPLEVPQNFRVDPTKPVTDKTADFLWDAVNTGPWRMQGFFRGYKVSY